MVQKYKVRQSAKEDIKDIGHYTLKQHGRIQRDKYLKGIKECFDLIADAPTLGRLRNDIRQGYYCKEYGKHVVFYLIKNNHIEITAILHESMIPQHHL
jgi:toxin ParE1/3/4